MTDAELDRITELAMSGELDEAEFERLTEAAIRNGEALLADPAKLAEATANPFVLPPAVVPIRRSRKNRKHR